MGTRRAFTIRAAQKKDHPHAYGDKYGKEVIAMIDKGSSPRVWGQVVFVATLVAAQRIIPTRMGTRRKYLWL